MNNLLYRTIKYITNRFKIAHEQESHTKIIQSIEANVEFKGINAWTLVFAIFIASIGLNTNSTAVIIGAMLISPLMGPILGLGMSIGIYDMVLLKKSFRNLSVAILISIITSTVYFILSPLKGAQSELLARTTPTIYDVLIALFGGFAGIVTSTGKEKGNAIPGVAIATALMPPLCTAGYGIATANFLYFIGAFYLFFINAVMISFSTLLTVRLMHIPHKEDIDPVHYTKVKRGIIFILIITILPSMLLAYQIISRSIFETKATQFIAAEINNKKNIVLSNSLRYAFNSKDTIELYVTGEFIDSAGIKVLNSKLPFYSLTETDLIIRQGSENLPKMDIASFKNELIENLYKHNDLLLKDKDSLIKNLQQDLVKLQSLRMPIEDLGYEVKILYPQINSFSAVKSELINFKDTNKIDTVMFVYISSKPKLSSKEIKILQHWFKQRLKFDNLQITNVNYD